MALGALIDAGADIDEIRALINAVALPGWQIEARRVTRGGISATKVDVHVAEENPPSRPYRVIRELIGSASLPAEVRERALNTFAALAEVEAGVHNESLDEVHFHEVGGHDAIIDIVGVASALFLLGVDEVYSSPVAVGMGTFQSAHGILANPAPAVVRLLEGCPTVGVSINKELTTPTGAALLRGAHAQFSPLPAMTIERSGFGAGSRELETSPNVTQVIIGSTQRDDAGLETVVVFETNLDDITGEALSVAMSALMDAGALDVWSIPIVMKKGRHAHQLCVLARPTQSSKIRSVIFATTGTLGVREQITTRTIAKRHTIEVEIDGENVRVKVGPHQYKAEADDVRRIAERVHRSFSDVASEAQYLARRQEMNR